MFFKATIREIDNGFIAECSPRLAEYDESFTPTFQKAIEWMVKQRKKYYPEKSPDNPTSNVPSEAAIKYTKLSGLVKKDYLEYLKSFLTNFPGQNPDLVLKSAHCEVVDGKVIFVGGA